MDIKYDKGDVVFSAVAHGTSKKHDCPDCLGAREWTVTSPAGTEYPTEESLSNIENYKGDFHHLMEVVSESFPSYGRCEFRDIDNTWEIATGGWSGCEDIIGALKSNVMFWIMCWKLSKRGGYFEFEVRIPHD